MIKEEQLDNMLYEKMQKEYDSFLEKIKSEQSLKPNQAIESAYEIVYKQDILYCFEDNDLNLSYKEKKHLLSKKRPLEFLYQEWLTTDCTHMQMLMCGKVTHNNLIDSSPLFRVSDTAIFDNCIWQFYFEG